MEAAFDPCSRGCRRQGGAAPPGGPRMPANGAFRPLPCVQVKVPSLNPQPPFAIGGGNCSSCPKPGVPGTRAGFQIDWDGHIYLRAAMNMAGTYFSTAQATRS